MPDSERSADAWDAFDLFNPTPEHALLRETLQRFVRDEVEPQAPGARSRRAFQSCDLFRRLRMRSTCSG